MAHYFMAQVYQYRLEVDTVGRQAQVAIDMCEKHGFESFHAQATVLLGWATAASGESNLGIETIQRGLKAWQATGTGMRRPYFLALLGDALFRANLLAEGIEGVVGAAREDQAKHVVQLPVVGGEGETTADMQQHVLKDHHNRQEHVRPYS